MANRNLSNEEFQFRIDNIFNGEFVLVGNYINKNTLVTIRHICCNHEFTSTPAAIISYKGKYSLCPKCRADIRAEIKSSGENLWKHKKSTRIRSNRYDTKRYKEKVFEICGDEYSVIGEYVKSNKKIRMRHNTCEHEWDVIAGSFVTKNGTRCPECNKGNSQNALTQEAFVERVFTLTQGEYTVLGNYVKADLPILIKHNICNHEWNIRPEFFMYRGTRCPKCNRGEWTLERYLEELTLHHNNRFTLLSEFRGVTNQVLVYDNKCKHTYRTTSSSLIKSSEPTCPVCAELKKSNAAAKKISELKNVNDHVNLLIGEEFKILKSGFRSCLIKHICGHEFNIGSKIKTTPKCPKCKSNNSPIRISSTIALKQRIFELVQGEYEVLSEFAGSQEDVKFRHNACNTVFSKKPSYTQFILANGKHPCPACCGIKGISKTNEQFQKDLDDKHGKDVFKLLSEYKKGTIPVLIRHNCGNEYEVTPNSLLASDRRGNKCTACSSLGLSVGEQKIKETLDLIGVKYEMQYKLPGCKRNRHHLRFDFAIFKSGKLSSLIEFDGEQHFKPVKHFGGEKKFKDQQESDNIKNNYCKINGIDLLRISYVDINNIESVLKNEYQFYKIA